MVDAAVKPSVRNTASALYEADFYAWTQEQAGLLKAGRLDEADLANILEEIETLGRKEVSELRSRYRVLLQHLLKQIYQPEKSSRSWTTTILNQRIEIAQHMEENPSLKAKADTIFLKAYADARKLAASETGLDIGIFPATPPFTRDQAVDQS
ncbi:DUF29 domain-containing protein [Beijerinckia sp. L45]|uniref:DUF29 domain-containing protein n=1 Tax=Beijerinckia sp. L45 TaxID=1641855 RepID=UPI00131B33F5|nr:DUF29 domain-containing protein [Beijerinckia sp. L45]